MNYVNPIPLGLLGGFRLGRADQEIRLPTGKATLMLAFLACARDRTARRDRLASLLWPQADVEQARGSLRQTLSRLRSALGDARDTVWSDNEQIGLKPQAWTVDVDALHACDGKDPAAVDPAWAAEFLAGMHKRDPSIDAWLEGERQRQRQAVNRVFSCAIDTALQSGDPARALELAVRLTALDPFAEPAHRQTMLAYEQAGDRPSALRQYRTLVRVLDQGLGVAPDADTRALYERLRQNRFDQPPFYPRGAGTTVPESAPVSPETMATVAARCQRLVTVLALRYDESGISIPDHDRLIRQYGGEPLLSHGAESTFVFGLDNRSVSGTAAALRAALNVRESSTDAVAVACGCASGLVHIDADAYPVGSVIQRAARFALLADAGDLVVDRAVLSQLPPQRQVEEITLRNQPAYQLHEIDLQPSITEHELFGRRVELAQLERLLNDSPKRGATLVVLAGEAGMGKSHLMCSLEVAAQKRGSIVLRLAFSPHDVSPISMIEQLARALHDGLMAHDISLDFDDVQRATLARLLDSLRRTPALANEDESERRFELITTMLAAFPSEPPVLLIVEDCHWADSADISLLIDLMDHRSEQALLLVATERRENETFAPALASRVLEAEVICLTLTPLSRSDAQALVARHVQDDTVQQRILERAGGHPLFLTQLADIDLEAQTPVPVSVVALVQSELDRLTERGRDACLKAAVLGADFVLATLESVFPEIDREDMLTTRLLKQQGERMSFGHVLVHEAIYALLSSDARSRLHRLAAEHFRTINAGEYAYHALRCGDTATAIEACCEATERLLYDNRYSDVKRLVAHALQLDPAGDQLARLHLSMSQLQRDQGDLDSAVATCQAAYDHAKDAELKVRTLVRSSTLLKRRRALDRAAAQLRLASRIAEATSLSPTVLAELEHEWGNNMFMKGKASLCFEHHLRAREYAEKAGDLRMQAAVLGGLGDAYYVDGKARSAKRCFTECVQFSDANAQPLIAIAYRPMAAFTAHLVKPGLDELQEDFQKAICEAQRWKSPGYEMLARLAFMEPLLYALRNDDAEAQLSAMEALQVRVGGDRFVPDQLFGRLLWRWARGEEDLARQLALEGVKRFGNETYMGPSFHAALAALCNDDTQADQSLSDGEALLYRGSLLHNQVGYAEFASACYWRRGQPERAIAKVQLAQQSFDGEPVGILQACLDWMRSARLEQAAPEQEAMNAILRQDMGLFTITHPYRFRPFSGAQTVVASTTLC